VGYLLLGRQVDDALPRSNQVVRSLAHGAQSEHAAPSQPPRRRHRRKIGRAVFVQGGDQGNRSAKIQNCGFDGSVHELRLPDRARPIYPLLAVEFE
jgi:hypothetical protein